MYARQHPPTLVALDMWNSKDASGEKSSQDVERSSELFKVIIADSDRLKEKASPRKKN